MAGGYLHKPDGTEGVGGILRQLQAQVNALRGGAGIRSAILRGVQLVFQDEDGNTSGVFGRRPDARRILSDGTLTSEPASGSSFFDPTTGTPLFVAHKYEVTGDSLVQAGSASGNDELSLFRVFAADVGINGDDVDINSTVDLSLRADGVVHIDPSSADIRIATGTTGSAANLYKDPFTGQLARSTSALRYKTDVAEADVEPAEVLALVGRTWVDKAKIDKPEQPPDVRRDVGFIAEELDEHPSLRQFVVYNEGGEPDAIEYDRLTVALLAVIKDQQARLDDHEERLARLESGGK